MRTAKHREHRLASRHVEVISNLVRDMDVVLRPTWSKVAVIAKSVTRADWSRQSLSAHQPIADAYQDAVTRHALLRQGKGKRFRPAPLSADEAKDQKISRQSTTIADQAELIEAYQDLLIRIIGNAIEAGITQERLEAPLAPREDRRSDLDRMADRTKEARRKQRRQ